MWFTRYAVRPAFGTSSSAFVGRADRGGVLDGNYGRNWDRLRVHGDGLNYYRDPPPPLVLDPPPHLARPTTYSQPYRE